MHDVETLNVAYEKHWGFELKNRWLDTMDLTLNLERDGAFADQPAIRRQRPSSESQEELKAPRLLSYHGLESDCWWDAFLQPASLY